MSACLVEISTIENKDLITNCANEHESLLEEESSSRDEPGFLWDDLRKSLPRTRLVCG
jgi:hypothetical protein